MKKLLMMMAMAVGFTVFAGDQNDKLISFSTSGTSYYQDGLTKIVDNECFALVWIKDGSSFGGFNADGTLKDAVNNKLVRVVNFAKDGHCPPITFVIPADEVEGIYAGGSFAVYLLDTRDANGQPTVAQNNAVGRINWFGKSDNSGAEVDTAEDVAKVFGSYICTYADGKPVLEGERCLLVQSDANGVFCGITWQGVPEDAVVATFFADKDGKFAIDLAGKVTTGKNYELIVLDSRIPGGAELVSKKEEAVKLVSGFGEFVLSDDGAAISKIKWTAVKMGADAVFNVSRATFGFDPSANLETGYAAIFDLSEHPGLWAVYPLPKAYVTKDELPATISGEYDKFRWPSSTIFDDSEFQLDTSYAFDAYEKSGEAAAAFDLFFANHSFLFPGVSKHNFDKRNLIPNARAVVKSQYPGMDELVDKVFDWYDTVYPFFNWNADFVVTFDRPVAADSVILAGNYAGASEYGYNGWVCSSARALAAGEEFRLLTDNEKKKVYVAYHEICTLVKEFKCGAINNSSANYGTTMTVKLYLYPNIGTVDDNSTRYLVGTYKYTFKGPLNVAFNPSDDQDDVVKGTVNMPEALDVMYDGTSSFPLPVPEYDKESNKEIAFVGWSNRVEKALWTTIPANTWATKEAPINLFATWKSAKIVVVSNNTGIVDKPVKVTTDWVEANIGEGKSEAEVQKALNEPVGNDTEKGTLKKWEAYVLGLDATDPNAVVKVDQTAGAQEDKAIVLSTVQAPPPDSGFKVAYSLDKVEDNEETVKKTVDERDTNDLTIELEPTDGDTPTGYYKMNVIVTPDNASPIKYPAENTIGVLKVESEEKLVPVAVPWLSLEKGEEVLPNEIVDPRTLSEGDKLHVYNDNVSGQSDIYSSWIVSGGVWKPVDTVKLDNALQSTVLTKAAAREGSVQCGKGAWLERLDTTKPFYLIGQYDKDAEVAVQIKANPDKAEYNLIAPTGIGDTDLNEIPSLTSMSAGINSKDQLMVMNKGVPTFLRPHEVSGGKAEWGYYKSVVDMSRGYPVVKQVWSTEAAKVNAGLGLWYISSGGTPKIVWKEGRIEESK